MYTWMNNTEEVSAMTTITNFDAYLNADVESTLQTQEKLTSHVENMKNLVNDVNLTKEIITAYLKAFESAVIAGGMKKESVKVLKSNRKCILEFAIGLRKGQEDKAFWTAKACKDMALGLADGAPDIAGYAKACRQALQDEAEPKVWILEEKLAKLIEKALEEGYSGKDIEKAFKALTTAEVAKAA